MQFPFFKACQINSHNASVPNDEFMLCSVIISLLAPTGVTFPLRLARGNDKNNTNNNTCESTANNIVKLSSKP